jgi:hypothetical protein
VSDKLRSGFADPLEALYRAVELYKIRVAIGPHGRLPYDKQFMLDRFDEFLSDPKCDIERYVGIIKYCSASSLRLEEVMLI